MRFPAHRFASAPVLALAALPAAAHARTPARGDTAARADRVERSLLPLVQVRGRAYAPATVAERMRTFRVPAVSVAVVDSGRLAWARAYGFADVASGRRATPQTLFQAASMSKPVASVAALQLVAEGRLALDEDVNAKLRSWRVPASDAARGRPVTLRGLLTHSAGLTVHGFPGYTAGAPVPTAVQVLDGGPPANTNPVRVDREPGARWRYSGGGMTVMQLLVSDVAGRPFPELLRERVLAPAGMTRSTFEQPLPAARADEAATGYDARGQPVAGRYHTYPEMAAAGLWTTPADLARWIVAVQHAAAGGPGALVPRALAASMLTPGVGGWGLGVGLGGAGDSLRFEHGGSNAGFRGQFVGYVSGGRGVVVMTNADRGGPLAAELVAAVAREYGWPGFAAQEVVPVAVAADRLAGLAGRYVLGDRPVGVDVAADGPTLWLTLPGGDRRELVPTGDDQSAMVPGGAPVRFERGADGAPAAVVAGGDRLVRAP